MSVSVLPTAASAHAFELSTRLLDIAKANFDKSLVRYDAWFLVFVAVILALGAALITGMAIWCVIYQRKRFTGRWQFKDWGLRVYFECV